MNTEFIIFLGPVATFVTGFACAYFYIARLVKKDSSYKFMNWITCAKEIGADVEVDGLVLTIKLPDHEVHEFSFESSFEKKVQKEHHTNGKIYAIKLANKVFFDVKKAKEYVESVCE